MRYPTAMTCLLLLIATTKNWAQHEALTSINSLTELLAQAEVGEWEVARKSQGITLKYRDVTLNHNQKTRQLLVEFSVTASLDSLLNSLKSPVKFQAWNEGFRSCKLLEEEENTWITHVVYNIPYPLSQQDLVAQYRLHKKYDRIVISSRSLPNYQASIKGYEREKFNFGEWTMTPDGNGNIEVTFTVITLSDTRVPSFIKDPIIRRKLIRSFSKLKTSLYNRT